MSMRVLSFVAVSISLALGSVAVADELPDLTKTPGVSRPGLSKSDNLHDQVGAATNATSPRQ